MTVHWPLLYLETVKRPGKRYFWRAVIQEDYAFWVLAASWLSPTPLVQAAALLFLLLSFWSLYELGYAENDWVAYNSEGAPGKVPRGAHTVTRPPEWPPWAWALVFALPGVVLLRDPAYGTAWWSIEVRLLGSWFGLLVLTRLIYSLYNHVAPVTRVVVYPLLQGCRTFGVCAAVSINDIGMLILIAHGAARSVPYLRYRLGPAAVSGRWPETPGAVLRPLAFMLLWLALAMFRRDMQLLLVPQAIVILLWCVFRARKELVQAMCY